VELEHDLIVLKNKLNAWGEDIGQSQYANVTQALKAFKQWGIPITRLVIPNQKLPTKFFRARIISSSSDEDLSDPNTFSYPPVEFTKSYQRANVPGYPVFYGALDAHTALEEIRKNGITPIEKGDQVFLSEWRLKPNSSISLKYLTLPEISTEKQLYSPLTIKVYKELTEIFKGFGEAHVEYQHSLFEEISRLFLGDNYMQSSIIAYDIMFNTPKFDGLKIDGIIYPSCSNNFRSVNCALAPGFVDQNLELVEVRKFTFKQFTEDGAQASSMYRGENEQGFVKWKVKVSELLTDQYDVLFMTDYQWNTEKTNNASFFHCMLLTNLDEFCKESINKINKSVDIAPKEGYKLDLSKELCCVYEIPMDNNATFLQSGDQKNPIHMVKIIIPLRTFFREINSEEVLRD
jgi:hypothetical protein